VGDLPRAHLLAALLGSAGIRAEVRSESLGPYPVTVGPLAAAWLWVEAADRDAAADLLTEAGVSAPESEEPAVPLATRRDVRILAGIVAVLVFLAVALGLLRVF